jgi:spermidine synthase
VIDMLQHFHDSNSRVLNDERTKLVAADARRFVAATPHSYDVIVADLFHPGRDGAARLYTREHFENVRSRLQPGGVFTQWLPLHQLDPQAFKSIVATFLAVFDDAHGFLGMYNVLTPSFALVGVVPDGKGNAFAIDIDALSGQLKHPEYRELRMPEPRDVLGAYMLDRAGLEALSRGSLLNEDRFPRVQYFASRLTYTTDVNRGWANLELLLAHRTSLPYELLEAADSNLANTIFEDANRFAQALALYLEGEYHRIAAGPNGGFPEAALNKYFAAYDVAPQFLASRSMLLFAASRSPADRKLILERMLARTPDDPRLGRLYRSHLRKLSRQPSSGQLDGVPRRP